MVNVIMLGMNISRSFKGIDACATQSNNGCLSSTARRSAT